MHHEQLDLFTAVIDIYTSENEPLSNHELYDRLASRQGLGKNAFETAPVGKAAAPVSILKRKIRWYQQTLKHAGVLRRVEGERGVWSLVNPASEKGLARISEGVALLGFSTKLGIAVLSSCEHFFSRFDEAISLVVTSPPYPLAVARRYGNPTEAEYVDWLCATIEPVVKNLAPGGSICLNIGNDIFMPQSPARSLYRERLVIALSERFGLYKMDELIWCSPKPPGPVQWASKKRVQLNVGYEPIYWFTNDPTKVRSDNRRVLQPHTEQHLKFVRSGGVKNPAVKSDGAYRVKSGSYSNETPGRIARNVFTFSHGKEDQNAAYKSYCETHGLVPHGASMPISLAKFLINFLSQKGDLVVDMFAGRMKVAKACEDLGRRWVCTERVFDYLHGGGASLFGLEPTWAKKW